MLEVTRQTSLSCPKCSAPRADGAAECLSCGVIFSRLHSQAGSRPRSAVSLPEAHGTAAVAPTVASEHAYLSPAALERLLCLLSDAMRAGLTPHGFVRSAGMHGIPAPIVEAFRRDTEASLPLSSTFQTLELLDPPSLALLRAKEHHGGIPEALAQIAERIAERRRARNRMIMLLAYPGFLVLSAILIFPLPVLFSCTGGVLAYLARVAPPLALLAAVPVFALVVIPRMSPGAPLRRALRHFAATFPLLRPVTFNSALASFADVLGSTLKAGLPMRQALSLAAEGSLDPAIAACAPSLVARLDSGQTLAEVMAGVPGLPDGFIARVASGEQSGTLDAVLPRLVEEHRSSARIALTVTLIAIAIAIALLVIGALAVKVVAFWSGYFQGRAQGFERILQQ